MNKPTVSIIMSTYNDGLYIKDAIDSVLSQSFTNWEFIILNDASTDNTENIIKEYIKKDKRIRYVKNKKNSGQTKNENKGVKLAKGEFIAKIDGDDIWIDKDKLRKQIKFLKTHAAYGFVGCFWININKKGEKISESIYPTNNNAIKNYLLTENCFLHSGVLIRKSVLGRVGSYDIQYEYTQDYDLWLRIGKVYKLYNIPEFMVQYRINPQGVTMTKYKKQLEETYKIIQQYKYDYPNFIRANILWQVRKYIPKNNNTLLILKTIARKFILRKS